MTELSNLLRQRLAGGPKAGVRPDSHPDADTLTAYVERLLPAAERNQVLAHLAACAHCRDVTALALPGPAKEEQVAAAAVPPARRWGFLWSPRFGIAASLATVAIVATILFQLREKPAERGRTEGFVGPVSGGSAEKEKKDSAPAAPEVARLEAPAQPSANAEAGRALSSVNDAVRHAQPSSTIAGNRLAPPPAATTTGSAVTDVRGLAAMTGAVSPGRRDYVNSEFFANNASDGPVVANGTIGELPSAPSPRIPSQIPPTTLGINAANTKIFADMPTENTGTQTVKTIAPPSGSSRWVATMGAIAPKVKKALSARATPAIPLTSLGYSAMGGPGQLNPSVSEAAAAAAPLDSGAGGLERSGAFRSRALADASVNAKAEMRESAPSPWRISGGKLVRPGAAGSWLEACQGAAAVEFTAFTAHGNELWAGGANVALIHSHDGGATCERITLGASAIGTIVRIEALGSVVQVKSSSGQSWSSHDGGKTWKMDE